MPAKGSSSGENSAPGGICISRQWYFESKIDGGPERIELSDRNIFKGKSVEVRAERLKPRPEGLRTDRHRLFRIRFNSGSVNLSQMAEVFRGLFGFG